jgi:prepilin-type N-terminal cleavage/methylation domain-containing protein
MRNTTERGFTLIEVMIVVVLLGILAALVLPSFLSEAKKAKASTEIAPFFAELSAKEEEYKVNGTGAYLAASACPSSPSSTKQDITGCVATNMPWRTLRVVLPEQSAYCSYTITAGSGTGTNNPSGFTFASPAVPWFYIIATCDMDGSSSKNSKYFTSSVDPTIQTLNEGS